MKCILPSWNLIAFSVGPLFWIALYLLPFAPVFTFVSQNLAKIWFSPAELKFFNTSSYHIHRKI